MLESWHAALVGALAQFFDGTLGMGFGMLSTTLLITIGASAAVASASVHLAEIGTTLVSGFSHWRENNVDTHLLKSIAIPGAIGAFAGANFLSNLDLALAKNFVSTVLFLLGLVVVYKVVFAKNLQVPSGRLTLPTIGLLGGFIDAAGGGGWGPIATPSLMSATRYEPRKIVGTVNAAEFIVAVSASLGFLVNFSRINLDWSIVFWLAIGGMAIAPFAAKLVAVLPKFWLGLALGFGIIVFNGIRILIQ